MPRSQVRPGADQVKGLKQGTTGYVDESYFWMGPDNRLWVDENATVSLTEIYSDAGGPTHLVSIVLMRLPEGLHAYIAGHTFSPTADISKVDASLEAIKVIHLDK